MPQVLTRATTGCDEEKMEKQRQQAFHSFLNRHPDITQEMEQARAHAIALHGIRYQQKDGSVLELAPALMTEQG